MRIGEAIIFVDSVGREYDALVTAVHEGMAGKLADSPGVNVVYVSGDESRTDSYGRQVERATSVVHESAQPASGMFWRFNFK